MKEAMKLLFKSLIVALFILFTANVHAAYAQYFKFDVSGVTQPVPVNSNFTVKVMINTAGIQTISGDALVIFDPTKVSINSATSGNFFTYFSGTPLGGATNKYLVSSWEESITSAKSSSSDTLFATLNMTAKANGSTSLSFDCTASSEADSNINQASDSKDIIKCDQMTPVTLTIGTGGTTTTPGSQPTPTTGVTVPTPTTPAAVATATPIPNIPPTNTPVPAVSELPKTGMMEVTFAALGMGVLLTVVGVLFIL